MPGPLALAGIGFGVSLASSALSSNTTTTSIDPRVIESIMAAIRRNRSTRFVPDEADFNENIQLQIDEIMFQAGVGEEALLGDFASRGINRSPQAIEELIRQVRAPAVRAAGSAVVQGKLAFQELEFAGLTAQQQFENQLLQILTGGATRTTEGPNQLGSQVGEFGNFLFEFGLLKEFGLFDAPNTINLGFG